MVNHMQPKYKIPSRHFFSKKIIPSIYFSLKQDIQRIVEEASFLCMTSDGWTSNYTQDSFLSFTCHAINAEGKQQSVLLHSKYFPEKSTSENISELIKKK